MRVSWPRAMVDVVVVPSTTHLAIQPAIATGKKTSRVGGVVGRWPLHMLCTNVLKTVSRSPAQPPVSAGSRSASPCSSSGTPSPRVIPVVVPSGNHYIRAAVAPTTLCDMAEPVRLGSTKRAPITPEFSDSEGEEEEEGCLVASRGTANLGALGGQAINYRATSRPLAPESADEDRRRRRSSSPQVLPWRVASTTIQQGLLLTADARPGVLQCGSRQLAVLGSGGETLSLLCAPTGKLLRIYGLL